MSDIDYHAVAAKLRERNPEPRDAMLVRDYYAAAGIWALADALDAVSDDVDSAS